MHIIYINTLVAYPTKVGSLIRNLSENCLMNFYTLTVLQKWKKTFGVVLFRMILRIYSSKGIKMKSCGKMKYPSDKMLSTKFVTLTFLEYYKKWTWTLNELFWTFMQNRCDEKKKKSSSNIFTYNLAISGFSFYKGF